MTDIISVVQLPIIEEHLQQASAMLQKIAEECKSLIPTEDNLSAIKRKRADAKKQFQVLEDLRKQIKPRIMEPYDTFDARYKELITNVATETDKTMKEKIDSIESTLLNEKVQEATRFMTEYTESKHIALNLTLADLGVHVIRSRSDKSIRDEIIAALDRIASELATIAAMDNSREILYEYEKSLDLPGAITIVTERHKAINAMNATAAEPPAAPTDSPEPLGPVEEIHAPVEIRVPEQTYTMTFTVRGSLSQLKSLKQYIIDQNIEIKE